ncbi:hypothetical protein GCM10027423_59050 [Spirosoma arcticum]
MSGKLPILLGLYLISLIAVHGQHRIDYRLGITGGPNANQIKKEQGGLNGIRWRYNAGITLEQRFSPTIALVYELIYSRQGKRLVLIIIRMRLLISKTSKS